MDKNKGFTFIEVIAVIVIIGIVSVFALAKSFDFQKTASEDVLLSKFLTHLKYARTNALNSQEIWGIGLNSSGYFLFKGENKDKVLLPGEENLVAGFSDFGNQNIAGNDIKFDKFGHPSDTNGNIKEFVFSLGNNSVKVYKSGYIK